MSTTGTASEGVSAGDRCLPGDPGKDLARRDRQMRVTAQPPEPRMESLQRGRLRSGLVTAAVLSILLGGLVLAVPGLGVVGHRVAHARWGWVALGGLLELASCVGYVLAFQEIFREVPRRFGMMVATAEQAFGAVVPVGGAGGIAAGGWLLSRAGMSVRLIAERSGVLFLLTSATNVGALVVAGAGVAIGVFAGPSDLLLTALPAAVGLAVLGLFVGLARRASAEPGGATSWRSRALRATAGASADTLRAVQRPGWRLSVGALAFLLCDVAVLWVSIHALGYDVPVAPLVLAYLIGYLGNVIPVPGGVGVLDGGLAGALILYHVPAPIALAGVLLYHTLARGSRLISGRSDSWPPSARYSSGRARPAIAPGRWDARPARQTRRQLESPRRRLRRLRRPVTCQGPGTRSSARLTAHAIRVASTSVPEAVDLKAAHDHPGEHEHQQRHEEPGDTEGDERERDRHQPEQWLEDRVQDPEHRRGQQQRPDVQTCTPLSTAATTASTSALVSHEIPSRAGRPGEPRSRLTGSVVLIGDGDSPHRGPVAPALGSEIPTFEGHHRQAGGQRAEDGQHHHVGYADATGERAWLT